MSRIGRSPASSGTDAGDPTDRASLVLRWLAHSRRALLPFVVVAVACGRGDRAGTPERARLDSTSLRSSGERLGGRRALLVGVQVSPAPHEPLPGPGTDVAEMTSLLTGTLGFNTSDIVVLRDRDATRDRVVAELKRLADVSKNEDLVLFYFSGHGVSLGVNYPPADNEATDQGLVLWTATDSATFLVDDELGYLLSRIPATRKMAVVDACFSGSVVYVNPLRGTLEAPLSVDTAPRFTERRFEGEAPLRVPSRLEVPPGAHETHGSRTGQWSDFYDGLLLAATLDSRKAYSASNWPRRGESHGVFTYFFTRELKAAPGTRSLQDFAQSLRQRMGADPVCTRYLRCQLPQLLGDTDHGTLQQVFGARAP